jgi:hypothetical protein
MRRFSDRSGTENCAWSKATIIANDFAGAIIPMLVSFLIVCSSCAKDVPAFLSNLF